MAKMSKRMSGFEHRSHKAATGGQGAPFKYDADKSKRSFTKHAKKMHPCNGVCPIPMRGGIRF